ncbi:PAS domain-containing sensor histidine kinase [Janthinobacterium agaricidamnosum]|uniref:histidine kinase n=1 Tax=Janthinobacterium agaricidamnosum NBRC 102515 = DSM 9628 TaxID=1349767 RepID=W0V1M6_9BURK|nr:PAS domain-containing sensor histidine kinase [Janthinobacterium agaricidamnosum]CDG81500.1 sensory box protein [Janthinobacterium agaricidamnosum NBRC 102515 = DSM 9628]
MKSPHSLAHRLQFTSPVRWLMPVILLLLFLSVLLWLPWQARQMESNERQEQLIADTLWVEQTIRFQLARDEESLRTLGGEIDAGHLTPEKLQQRLQQLLKNGRELQRVIWIDPRNKVLAASDNDASEDVYFSPASLLAADNARRIRKAQYSQPEPQLGNPDASPATMLMDYHLPLYEGNRYLGSLVATYKISSLLDEMVPWWFAQDNQISLIDRDDKVLARRAAAGPGHGVYTHKRALDVPGASITLFTDSVKSEPRLLPNLLVGSVIALSLGLLWSLLALWRHISRRLVAEGALRQQMLFRTAMENSLVTGLRARDLEGRVTYVNPAFCELVGYPAEEILGKLPPMPYWAPEAMEEYQERFTRVLAGSATPQFETVFQRSDGARLPVLIFESPLLDKNGRQTGWMGSFLDISDRKRVEELNRQQHEKLQTSARLATMGELASMLAHELNQPLAAISSYTTGALNLIGRAADYGKPVDPALLKPALEQASAQAQRAGQIIRSVHGFVKKRDPVRQDVAIPLLVDDIRALIDLQARKSYVTVLTDLPPELPMVRADRVMIEQVLLNLTRNAIEAMQEIAPERRIMCLSAVYDAQEEQVTVAVTDQGHGIAQEVAERLFSPFFSTKAEGMGMGLNICRTAIEFHGGTLNHSANPQGGTIFKFSLPAARPRRH